jgi:hypothetical protein
MASPEHAARCVDRSPVLKLVACTIWSRSMPVTGFAYDIAGHDTKATRERAVADRIFGWLRAYQASRFRALWEEFEAMSTPETRFANALDHLQALLQHMEAGGGSWAPTR